jgi:hypothetical protein
MIDSDGVPYASPRLSFYILQQKIAAVAAPPYGLRAAPDQLWMKISVAGVIAIAKNVCDLRTAVSAASAQSSLSSFSQTHIRTSAPGKEKLLLLSLPAFFYGF